MVCSPEYVVLIPSKTRAFALALGLGPVLASAGACSLVIESRGQQCENDDDCKGFGADAVCNLGGGVCVTPEASGSTGSAGCIGDDGCFACPPQQFEEFLNACTNAPCIPYDNATNLQGLLLEDGSVPPVP
jgi:hypothetical protein